MAQNISKMDISQEELELEQSAGKEVKEEEVRAKVIEEFGFDPETDQERIDKLVTKEMDSHKRLSTAIGQKIKYRNTAEELRKNPPKPQVETTTTTTEVPDVDKLVDKKLEQRDLEVMSYPDEIKKEIQRIAQAQGINVRQAERDPYIVFKIGEYEKQTKADEAAISRTNRSGGGKKNYSLDNPPDVDMATPEGRKEWDSWLSWAKTQ